MKTSPKICRPPADVVSTAPCSLSDALTSSLKGREESIVNLLSTINSQPVNTVLRDEARNPSLERAQNICIFSPQIRERDGVVSFPTYFDTGSIVVINEAERVVVRLLAGVSNEQSF